MILGYGAAAIANQARFGGQELSLEGGHVWGYTLSPAGGWSSPSAVAVFLLGPLALVAWPQKRDGEPFSADRAAPALRAGLVLGVLTVVLGVLSIVGRVLRFAPPPQWSAFFVTLGTGAGAVDLGLLGIIVARGLMSSAAPGPAG